MATANGKLVKPEAVKPDGRTKELFVEGWEFMQILGEGAYAEYVEVVHLLL